MQGIRIKGVYDNRGNTKAKIINKLVSNEKIIKVIDENNVTQ